MSSSTTPCSCTRAACPPTPASESPSRTHLHLHLLLSRKCFAPMRQLHLEVEKPQWVVIIFCNLKNLQRDLALGGQRDSDLESFWAAKFWSEVFLDSCCVLRKDSIRAYGRESSLETHWSFYFLLVAECIISISSLQLSLSLSLSLSLCCRQQLFSCLKIFCAQPAFSPVWPLQHISSCALWGRPLVDLLLMDKNNVFGFVNGVLCRSIGVSPD